MELMLFIIYFILHVLDGYTTIVGIKRGYRECNFIIRKLFNIFGVLPSLIIVKSIALVLALPYLSSGGLFILLLLDIFYAWIVIHNFRLLLE